MGSATVDVEDNRDQQRVEARLEDGEVAGFAEYRRRPDGSWDFFHTEVDDRWAGQGIGTRLVEGALELVRGTGGRVVPTCEFVRSHMAAREETHDLLADGASVERV